MKAFSFLKPSTKELKEGEVIIPKGHIDAITNSFGSNVDLHRDVLQTSPDKISATRLQIAYFRRRRKLTTKDLVDKEKFEAVRKAYEILTNPKWAAYYQKYGLNQHCAMETNKNQCSLHEKQVSGASEPANASKTDFPTTEINTIQSRLNKNQVLKASETKKTGVRWKDDVDTYIIQADSNSEHKKPRKKQKKKKRKSPRILVDLENAKQLEDYLRQLDEEARPTTDRDFWDTLEDSIDGLLSVFSGDSSQGSVPTAKKPWYYKF